MEALLDWNRSNLMRVVFGRRLLRQKWEDMEALVATVIEQKYSREALEFFAGPQVNGDDKDEQQEERGGRILRMVALMLARKP